MAKYAAFGTAFKLDGTAFFAATNFSGPALSADTEDVTSHDSTGGYAEYVVTILRPGELTFDIVYDPANATHKNAAGGLLYLYEQKTADEFTLVWPDDASTTWTFDAFITGFEPSAPVNGVLTASVTVLITGQPTLV